MLPPAGIPPLTAGDTILKLLVYRSQTGGIPGVSIAMAIHEFHLVRVQDSIRLVDAATGFVRTALDDCLDACPAEQRKDLEATLQLMLGSRFSDLLDQSIAEDNDNAN